MYPYANDDDDKAKRCRRFIDAISGHPEVTGAIVVSLEGLPIASTLPERVDEIKVAGMIAALFSLSEGSVTEMEKGEFSQLFISGSNGYILIMQIELNTILAIFTTKNVRFGLFLLEVQRMSEKLNQIVDHKS